MKQYSVKISDKAATDMEAIYAYIAIHLKASENAL